MRRKSNLAVMTLFATYGSILGSAAAAPPLEPSNLRVKALGVNSFLLKWADNSKDETGFEIKAGLKSGGNPPRYQLLRNADLTSYTVITNDLPGKSLDFQVTAYNGGVGAEIFSGPTSKVTVAALATKTFGTPSALVASVVDDGQFKMTWKDNSTSEHGYELSVKRRGAAWEVFGSVGPGLTFSVPTNGFEPSTSYSFRVRAFRQNPLSYTAFSNVVTATTKAFQAPTDFVANSQGDGTFTFKWTDRSSIESGYEIQRKATGETDFTSLGTVATNVRSTSPVPGFRTDVAYQFRARAFRIKDNVTVYTGFSNVVPAKYSLLKTPTVLAASALSDSSVKLTWTDNSTIETGYLIEQRKSGATAFTAAESVSANVSTSTITGLVPGTSYDFRVRATAASFFGSASNSAYSSTVTVLTKDGVIGDLSPPIFYNTSFVYLIGTSRASELTSLAVSSLPAGLSFDASLGKISGSVTVEGVKTVLLTATFKDASIVQRNLVLRIIRPPSAPVQLGSFSPVSVPIGASSAIPVSSKFSDPDATRAALVDTTLGNFNIILYPAATPLTVANFLSYRDDGRYTNSFYHRSVSGFVIQGGGYKYTSSGGFTDVPKYAAVKNEPGISNLSGTVAMAKTPGSPDSATSEFFVNVNDSLDLDEQNSGFTVFGRVPDAQMSVVNAINSLPVGSYKLQFGSTIRDLDDVPMNTGIAPLAMEPNLLVKINSVTEAPILSYSASSLDVTIATVTMEGSDAKITGVATGSTTVRIEAKDLDGESVTQDIAVTVP